MAIQNNKRKREMTTATTTMAKKRPSGFIHSPPPKTSTSRSSSPVPPPSQVDSKLLHLVRKLGLVVVDQEPPPSVDYVVNCLKTQHREYQRKDPAWLKRNVQRALVVITSASTTKSPQAKPPQLLSSKRALQEEEAMDQEEAAFEQEAQEHDAVRQELIDSQSSGSMLNAGLRDKYKQDVKAKQEKEASEQRISRKLKRKKSGLGGRSTSQNGLTPMPSSESSHAVPVPRPKERYADLGGLTDILTQIRQLIEYPLVRPELYQHLGIDPPRGVLLRGPPGCGKTHLANAIAGQLNLPYFCVSAPELVSSMSGESESRIRDLFRAASDTAPALIFMDELDAIAPKRGGDASRGMEKRMVAQLLTCLDSIDPQYNRNRAPVMVLGATNRPDAMDPALRRAGRFDKEILLGIPDQDARESILQTMTTQMRLAPGVDFKLLAKKTPGFVGADMKSLTKEAAVLAINRIFENVLTNRVDIMPATNGIVADSSPDNSNEAKSTEIQETKDGQSVQAPPTDIASITPLTPAQMDPLYVTMTDFLNAVPLVQPSSKREGFATVPDVTWDDIGALAAVRQELSLSVLEPIQNPEKFQALGLPLPAGVMLYGPPGCGKTLLAKAIANESGANFISVKGPELLDKYVGESERAVRVVFERARSSSPCIVFFDELDSLCPKRGSDSGGGGVSERVVNQLLTEMDGLDSRRSVFVIAATNRPELIDPAMVRPGRLDKLLYVPVPSADDRVAILKALATKVKLGPDVHLDDIGRSARAEGYSGADCAALLREAGLAVLKESHLEECSSEATLHISARHFAYAFDHVMPSVSKKDQARYDRMRDRMARARTRGSVAEEEDSAAIKENPRPTEMRPEGGAPSKEQT